MEGDKLGLDERIRLAMRASDDTGKLVGPAWAEESFRDFTGPKEQIWCEFAANIRHGS